MFTVAFIQHFTLNNFLLEGCILTEQHNMFSVLLWDLNRYLHSNASIAPFGLCVKLAWALSLAHPRYFN